MKNKRLSTTFKTSVLKNADELNIATKNPPQILAGKKVIPGTDRFHIQAALESSYRQGTIKKSSYSSNLMCDLSVLNAYGAQVSYEPITYSFLGNQTDTEEIDNENIMPNYTNVQNKNINTLKSFKNIEDSFYTLDEQRPFKIQESYEMCAPNTLDTLSKSTVTAAALYFAQNRNKKRNN